MLMNWSLKVLTTFPCKKPVIFEFICQLYFITSGRALFSANILEIDHSNSLICFLSPLVFKNQTKRRWEGASACLQGASEILLRSESQQEVTTFGLLVTT